MAYGRLRIHDSPRFSSPASSRRLKASNGSLVSPRMSRSLSADGLAAKGGSEFGLFPPRESTPLIQLPSDGPIIDKTTGLTDVSEGPALAAWIGPALMCGFAYGTSRLSSHVWQCSGLSSTLFASCVSLSFYFTALYNIFIKLGSYSINPVLGGVVLQFVAALLGIILLTYTQLFHREEKLHYDREGIVWSICAGAAVGVAEMLSFFVSGMGVQAVQSIPVIIGGSVMFGTVLGYLLLKENLSFRGWLGVLMLVAGICLVGTDPGAVESA
jgi:transporter family protein